MSTVEACGPGKRFRNSEIVWGKKVKQRQFQNHVKKVISASSKLISIVDCGMNSYNSSIYFE